MSIAKCIYTCHLLELIARERKICNPFHSRWVSKQKTKSSDVLSKRLFRYLQAEANAADRDMKPDDLSDFWVAYLVLQI